MMIHCYYAALVLHLATNFRLADAFSFPLTSTCGEISLFPKLMSPNFAYGTSPSLKMSATSESSQTSPLDEFNQPTPKFRRGDKIQVEVIRFGPLGASVEVIAYNSHHEDDLISESDPPLAKGLILQTEIRYFRDRRNGLDVIKGEILPAYVEHVRKDGKLDISLRIPGARGRAKDLSGTILEKLKDAEGGILNVGDRSSPEEINLEFPGTSKSSFKKAVGTLYKKGLIQPGPNHIALMKE
mmetsp:Transcript_5559/g.8429  ORF Transcript_5559/g.8429 Transcript_5559/m.8429 type:complete len:241 (-) Transcript_5559:116-838(-)